MRRTFKDRWSRAGIGLVIGPSVCVLSGCYERVAQGDSAVYRFAWWIGPMVILAGILGLPVGWLLRKKVPRWGYSLMILAPIVLVIGAPAIYRDRVVIDSEHFEAQFGLWFKPQFHQVRFDDLREIQYVGVRGNRGRTNYELRCVTKSGQVTVVPAGDLVRNTVPEILERAKAHGVAIQVQPD
jgi:hypothetical protein